MRQQIMTLMCVWCARRLVNGFALIAPRARIFLKHRIWKIYFGTLMWQKWTVKGKPSTHIALRRVASHVPLAIGM